MDQTAFRVRGKTEILLTAAEAYPALERLFLSATSEIWASFLVFDLSTEVRTDAARAIGGSWFDLLVHTLGRGVSVHFVIADFDPIARWDLRLKHQVQHPGPAGIGCFDTPDHDRPGRDTWHDVQVITSGPVAQEVQQHHEEFPDICAGRRAPAPQKLILRTLSRRRRFQFPVFGPEPVLNEILRAHEVLVSMSDRLIYLESQYFRDKGLAARPDRAIQHQGGGTLWQILAHRSGRGVLIRTGKSRAEIRHLFLSAWRRIQSAGVQCRGVPDRSESDIDG